MAEAYRVAAMDGLNRVFRGVVNRRPEVRLVVVGNLSRGSSYHVQ